MKKKVMTALVTTGVVVIGCICLANIKADAWKTLR